MAGAGVGLDGPLEAPEGRWEPGGEWAAAGTGAAGARVLGGLGPAPPRLTAGADTGCPGGGEDRDGGDGAARTPPLLAASTGEALHFLRQRRPDATGGARLAPLRELSLPGAAGQASCTALAAKNPGDSRGLLVGLTGGDVLCLDLEQQLGGGGSARKLVGEATFQPGPAAVAGPERRCTCLAWAPQSPGSFVAGYGDGSLRLFQKPLGWGAGTEGDGGGETTAAGSKVGPSSCWQVTCGAAITALAFSGDGQLLGVASRDGIFRVLDVDDGTLVAGCRSYYGGFLCLAWSPDSRFVALGGEDDLLSVYSVVDRCIVAWGDGHRSWVTGCAWDPWWEAPRRDGREASSVGVSAAGSDADEGTTYRIVSVAQDTQLLFWDFEPPESENMPEHRRAPSMTSLPVPLSPSHATGLHRRAASRSSDASGRSRTPSFSGLPAGEDPLEGDMEGLSFAEQHQCIAASVPRDEMLWMVPAAQVRAHQAPVCDVHVLQQGVATLCAESRLRLWLRPTSASAVPAEGGGVEPAKEG